MVKKKCSYIGKNIIFENTYKKIVIVYSKSIFELNEIFDLYIIFAP